MRNQQTEIRGRRWPWLLLSLLSAGALWTGLIATNLLPVRAQVDPPTVSVQLDSTDGSATYGKVKLIDLGNDMTRVIVAIHNGDEGMYMPHVHEGSCAAYDGDPLFPLMSFDSTGRSRTTVALSMDRLLSGDYLIDIHPMAATTSELFDPATAAVCGELTKASQSPASTNTSSGNDLVVTTPPMTGVGPISGKYWSTILLTVLAAVAIVSAGLGFDLRRRAALSLATRRLYAMTGRRP
jgi:hypothetical protein